jgi:signal peptidase II
VVDFLDVTIPLVNYRWPCFNVADSCICIAAGLLFFTGLKADLKAAK